MRFGSMRVRIASNDGGGRRGIRLNIGRISGRNPRTRALISSAIRSRAVFRLRSVISDGNAVYAYGYSFARTARRDGYGGGRKKKKKKKSFQDHCAGELRNALLH